VETNLVIFLGFVSVALIMNTLLIYGVYKALAGMTTKVTNNVSKITISSDAKAALSTLQSMSERAVAATEFTKLKLAEYDPLIDKAEQSYRQTLVKVDSTLDTVADQITTSADKARDLLAGPAFSAVAFAAGVTEFLQQFDTEE